LELASDHAVVELGGKVFDLAPGSLKRAGTIDCFRSVTQFFLNGELCANAAPRLGFAKAPCEKALKLLLWFAPGNDKAV